MALHGAARFIGAAACGAASRTAAEPLIEAGRFIEVERSFAVEQLQAPVTMAAAATMPPPAILTTRIAAAAITAASIAAAPCIAVESHIEVARLIGAALSACGAAELALLTMAADAVADIKSLGRCAPFPFCR